MRSAGIALALALLAAPARPCGVERWPVKLLADADAAAVSLAPVPLTIEAANALPADCRPARKRHGREFELFEVRGQVVTVIPERDGDLHVVLADNQGRTIVVEAPSASCAAPSRFRTRLRESRAALDRIARPGVFLTVRGVGFFDRRHGQRGMSRSCLEIHPVLWVLQP